MTNGEALLDRLEGGEALRCRNRDRDIEWMFTIEDGSVYRRHEDESVDDRKLVSWDMAALSLQAVAVEVEIVPIEEAEEL